MKKRLVAGLGLLTSGFLVMASPLAAQDAMLVLAENGQSDYQIVIPDKGESEIVEQWILMTAKLMEAAFEKNGFKIDVVKEGEKQADKPGIYLAATEFAARNGVTVDRNEFWAYRIKAVGQDLVICGVDKQDPIKTIRKLETPLAMLGTVKGACDFLREYAGVRFLFVNMAQSQYASHGDGLEMLDEDGSLKIDTRSIAFTPMEKIAVPSDIDVKKTPMMRANYDVEYETFYYIANNFFPPLSFVEGSEILWGEVLLAKKYAKSHPEYFALLPDGKRSCEVPIPSRIRAISYCVANEGVQDLMFEAAEKRIKNGEQTISIGTQDGFALCHCNCEACNTLFGSKAENFSQVLARGKSGKLWQGFFNITERIRKKYPDVRIVLLNYQDTPISIDVIQRFPENVIPRIQFASQIDFDKLGGVEFPAGVCGFEETFTGFGQAGPYLPERTPKHIAEFVRTLERNKVKWSARDGSIGAVRGMQAPAYYVYGRMLDDPSADWEAIQDEFCEAAFGPVVARPMKTFFDLLHTQIAIYSDFFGVYMPAWSREYSRSKYHDSKWHVMSMYPPEYCADADALLTSAEKTAQDPDVKARLHLIRIEFNYIRKLSEIFFLQNAWTLNPSQTNLDSLIDAIDDWHMDLKNLAGGDNKSAFQPLSDWPEMRPFNGHHYTHAALESSGYQQQWKYTCLNWDIAAIRNGILDNSREMNVSEVDIVPGIEATIWDEVPEAVLKERDGMPFTNIKATLKVLRDKEAFYVLVTSLSPSKHPEDILKTIPDGDIFKEEYVELGIAPPNSGGKVFRIAANPAEGSRFDSVLLPRANDRLTEDKSWNGSWEFAFGVTLEKSRWNLASRVWTAWFRIPFSDFSAEAPVAGQPWGFNVGRVRWDRGQQYLIWKDGQSATDAEALGKLVF